MKRLIMALALVAGVTWLGAGSPASATQPPTVNHPVEECEGTFIKDQGPSSGFSVTVAYTGNMWIKISNEHVFVPAVTVGETYGPKDVSGWPTNKKGKYQEISHVDYCVDKQPPPQEPVISTLGLTYNQDCAPDETNTWRIRPVDVKAPVAWELRYVGGGTVASGTMNPGDGEDVRDIAPRESVTAKLFYDSDGNGSLDKSTTKAGGSVLTDPALYEPGAKCGPEIPEKPEDTVEIVEIVDCEAQAVRTIITRTTHLLVNNEWMAEVLVEEKTRVLNDDEIAECTPTTTEPPVTLPPVTTEPPVTTAPPTTQSPQAQELPSTGSNGNVIALLATLLLAGGGGALALSRRS